MKVISVFAIDECGDEILVDSATVNSSLDDKDAELFAQWFFEKTISALPDEWKYPWWERNRSWQHSLDCERAEEEAWEQYLEECKEEGEEPDLEIFEERYRPDEFWSDNWF